MSIRSGDDFVHLRLPVASADLQLELLRYVSGSRPFLQELAQDDEDLAGRLERFTQGVETFAEKALLASFHEATGVDANMRPIAETDEHVEDDSDSDEESESERAPTLKRNLALTPHQAEAISKMELQPVRDEADNRQDLSSTSLDLQELSMKPMDFRDIVPSHQQTTSQRIKTPSQLISGFGSFRVPDLKAWRLSRSRKVSPETPNSDNTK
eukprot:TRINITY_DN92740_c0_g1_i1.p1 TRINITY_DN92740_c0_g1~~TRINITY_DN92740_c0_g1_i1.p1  ORF type:complete len:243 (+),score=40.99 TRINITY_DN92740_c0_g1_i1:94-729(+)